MAKEHWKFKNITNGNVSFGGLILVTLNQRNGLKAFVQVSCAQEKCKQVDVHLHMICCKLTNDQLQSTFDNGKTWKWLSNYSWECEKVLKIHVQILKMQTYLQKLWATWFYTWV